MDDESKKIFASRVLYSIVGDAEYLYILGRDFRRKVIESEEWKNFIETLREYEVKKGLVIYGAGAFGEKMIDMTAGVVWNCIIDRFPQLDRVRNVSVLSVEDYLKRDRKEMIVIPSKRYYEDMKSFLIENGVEESRIIDGTVLYELTEGRQYFDLEQLPKVGEKEVFLDVGCCDGMSSVQFMKWSKGNGYCYCFEPDESNMEKVKANFKAKGISENDYTLIPKGAWSEKGKISFVANGSGSSHVVGVYGENEASCISSIEVETIDSVAQNVPVSFIKMDIEGAELKALEGAQEVIKERKPKLAICVYHKAEDIWEIPEYILKLRPDYSFYLRHYSFEQSETVLYAI